MSPSPRMANMSQEALDNLESVSLTCVTPERDVKWYHQSKILLILDLWGQLLNSFSILDCLVVSQNIFENVRLYAQMDILNYFLLLYNLIWLSKTKFILRSYGIFLDSKHSTLICEVPTCHCSFFNNAFIKIALTFGATFIKI